MRRKVRCHRRAVELVGKGRLAESQAVDLGGAHPSQSARRMSRPCGRALAHKSSYRHSYCAVSVMLDTDPERFVSMVLPSLVPKKTPLNVAEPVIVLLLFRLPVNVIVKS